MQDQDMTENKRVYIHAPQIPILLVDLRHRLIIIPLRLKRNIILSSATLSFMNNCFLQLSALHGHDIRFNCIKDYNQ